MATLESNLKVHLIVKDYYLVNRSVYMLNICWNKCWLYHLPHVKIDFERINVLKNDLAEYSEAVVMPRTVIELKTIHSFIKSFEDLVSYLRLIDSRGFKLEIANLNVIIRDWREWFDSILEPGYPMV